MKPFEKNCAVIGGYHNHSDMSDGGSTLEEMCRAGKAAGLREFGMSDHWVIHPELKGEALDWRMDPARLEEYVTCLQKLKRELDSDDFTLRIGLEVDFFFENATEVLAQLRQYPLDYLIGAVHFAGNFGIDTSAADWEPLTKEEKAQICEEYWQKVLGAAQCREFAFLAHLDLPKKFGFICSEDYTPHALKVLDVLQQRGGAIELNTSGWFKPCGEGYPSAAILTEAQKRGIPVVINADAHSASHVTRNFPEAQALLERCGYLFRSR